MCAHLCMCLSGFINLKENVQNLFEESFKTFLKEKKVDGNIYCVLVLE